MGDSMISPEGLAINPRMPESWRICCFDPRAPESGHNVNRIEFAFLVAPLHFTEHFVGHFLRDRRPDFDDLVVSALRRW